MFDFLKYSHFRSGIQSIIHSQMGPSAILFSKVLLLFLKAMAKSQGMGLRGTKRRHQEEKGDKYEVTVETKDGALVDKFLVDKDTGWMRSAY
jgi:hypothetical protein